MNVFDLWRGWGPKFKAILDALQKLQRDVDEMRDDLAILGNGQRAIMDQLGRIETAVGAGGDAVTLQVVVGTPTEQE